MSLSSFVCFAAYLIFSQTLGEFIKTDSALMPIMFLQMLLFGIRSLKISEAKYYYKKWLPMQVLRYFFTAFGVTTTEHLPNIMLPTPLQ
jgi:hypothetical protein